MISYFALVTFLLCPCTPDLPDSPDLPGIPDVPDLQDTNWSTYLGDPGRRHYSELDQINRENVIELEVAWVYDSGEPRQGGSTMYTSPLIIDGVLYGLSPRLVAFALDAATGEELWRHDPGGSGAAQRGLKVVTAAGGGRMGPPSGTEHIAFSLRK